jgi:hypothetical protein
MVGAHRVVLRIARSSGHGTACADALFSGRDTRAGASRLDLRRTSATQ